MKKRVIVVVIAVLIIAATYIIASTVQSHRLSNEAAMTTSSTAAENVVEHENNTKNEPAESLDINKADDTHDGAESSASEDEGLIIEDDGVTELEEHKGIEGV